jgi:hypothetical protein
VAGKFRNRKAKGKITPAVFYISILTFLEELEKQKFLI